MIDRTEGGSDLSFLTFDQRHSINDRHEEDSEIDKSQQTQA